MKRILFLFVFIFALLITEPIGNVVLPKVSNCSLLFASVPRLMTYQGKLTDSLGVGINDTVQITFGLYRTPALGETLWTETHDSVVISRGLFSVILGSINPLDLPFDFSYFLRIIVDGDPLAPRVQQTAAPYAFRAIYADTIDLSDHALWEMEDVIYTALSPGDVLKWNGALWVPAVDAGAGGADGDWEIDGANMYSIPVGNVGIGEEIPTAKLHVNTIEKIGIKVGESDSIGIHVDNAEWHGVYVDSAGYAGIYVNQAHDWAGYFNGNGFFRGIVVAGSLYSCLFRDASYEPLLRSSDGSIDIGEDTDGSYNITTPHGLGGTGTDNYLARWNGANAVEASIVHQSDVGNLGIGTVATTARLAVYGSSDGLSIRNSTDDAVEIFNIADDGIGIYDVGGVGIQIDSTGSSGIIIDGASEYGLSVNNAKWAGVRIDLSGTHGISITNSANDGIRVTNSGGLAGNFLGDVNISQQLFVGNVPTDSDPEFLLTVIDGQIMKVDATAYEGSGLDADWGVNGDHIYTALPGNVGIGVVNPLAKLHIANAPDDGILVQTSGAYGIRLIDSHFHGVFVDSTYASGLYVGRAADNGLWVNVCGEHGANIAYAGQNGVNITYPEDYGVRVYRAGKEGIYIKEPDGSGVRITKPGNNGMIIDSVLTTECDGILVQNIEDDGIHIKNVVDDGIYIENAGNNGINIYNSLNNGMTIGNAPNKSMYIYNAGIDGVEITGAERTLRGIYIHDHSGVGNPDTGLVIKDVGTIGIGIQNPAEQGIRIYSPGTDGVYIDSPGHYGVRVVDPGDHGVSVTSTNYPNGTYGIYSASSHVGDTAGYFLGRVYVSDNLSVDGDLTIDNMLTVGGELIIDDSLVCNKIRIEDYGPALVMDGSGGLSQMIYQYNNNDKWRLSYSPGFTRLSFDRYSVSDWQTVMTLDDDSGFVGIGTTLPHKSFEVAGEVRVRSSKDVSEVVGSGALQIMDPSGTRGLHFDENEIQALGIDLYMNNSNLTTTHINNLVHVDTSGKVGISTLTPEGLVHIQSTGTIMDPLVVKNDSDLGLIVQNNGDVSIGTAGSAAKLDIYSESRDLIRAFTDVEIKFVVKNNGRVGIGVSSPDELLHVAGTAKVDVLKIAGGADLAEQFDVNDSPEPGMVVIIDDKNPGKLIVSSKAYDRRVAGIVSGAGGVNPGMLMSHDGTVAAGEYPVALSGRVYCMVDAANGPIQPGDLLTTSDIPGYAMKVIDQERAQGAIIGKAMSALDNGQGLVLVLVTLQ
ncbi:hypothetical protein JW877_10395 [bacterium]|nr:hypothetical protein [bacterium]